VKTQLVVNWLLAENQPGVRYLTLTQILGKPEDDSEVIGAFQSTITERRASISHSPTKKYHLNEEPGNNTRRT